MDNCVESLRPLSHRDYEIVVHDGLTDPTLSITERISDAHHEGPRLESIDRPNRVLSPARNLGARVDLRAPWASAPVAHPD